jgi:uncharacterized Zn-binding protein involved in type VI secretion
MNGVARVDIDSAGGLILGPGIPKVLINGSPVAVVGDAVAPHGQYQHAAPVLIEGSAKVFAGGKPVCRQGDAASCGHTIANGSSNVVAA